MPFCNLFIERSS